MAAGTASEDRAVVLVNDVGVAGAANYHGLLV